jgi:hypothetical protein
MASHPEILMSRLPREPWALLNIASSSLLSFWSALEEESLEGDTHHLSRKDFGGKSSSL